MTDKSPTPTTTTPTSCSTTATTSISSSTNTSDSATATSCRPCLADRLDTNSSLHPMRPSRPPTPVLRWLSNISPTRPSSTSSSPPSPNLTLLNEALNEPLRPPAARLPPSFRASRNLNRPPPFLDNLTRSTLPSSSLSPPIVSSYSIQSDVVRPPPIVLTHSPSSLESLRSFHTRSMSTHSADPLAGKNRLQNSSTTTSSWWWSQSDNNVSSPVIDDRPQKLPVKAETKKKYKSPRNPIVFCHGLLGFDSVTIGPAIAPLEVTHWRGIKEVLEENGSEVLITRVPATSSPAERAKVLEQRISQVYPGRSVHLIGHSMGGLDCRYLTAHLTQRKFHVLSITTIATPHRGSSFADHFLSTVGRARMPSVLSLLDLLPNGGGDGKAFECLTIESMRKFNEETPDVEGVRYFSWGAVYEPGLIDTWKWPHSVILEKEGPNDGLVSVESSKWGTYLGTLSQVNHLDLVGWINTARYKWAEMMGKEIEFRPATFYLGIADMLAHEVEGQENEGAIEFVTKGDGEVELQERINRKKLPTDGTAGDRGENSAREQMLESLNVAGAQVPSSSESLESASDAKPGTHRQSSTRHSTS